MDLSQIVNGIASVFNLATSGSSAAPAGTDLLTQIPGAATAVNYIRRQLVKLQQVPARLAALEQANKQLQAVATQRGDTGAVAKLQRLLANVAPVRFQYQDTAGAIAGVMLDLNASGYASPVPLELAAKTIKAAAGVAALFGNVEEAEKQLAAVARGLGVPVPAGVPAGVDLGQVAKWGAVAAGGFLALRALKPKQRR